MKTRGIIIYSLLVIVASFVLLFLVIENAPVTKEVEVEFETSVIQCEKGAFYPDSSYLSLANTALALGDISTYSAYVALANANGTYGYNITINIDGKNYIIEREEEHIVGEKILVTKIDYYENDRLYKTEYR